VRRYREPAFALRIDDFGAGYSMLDRDLALEPEYPQADKYSYFARPPADTVTAGDFVKALGL